MSRASTASEPLTRQSCESCRRKKTKCTAERPTCSFCLRLKTSCVYLPRGSSPANGVGKTVAVDSRKTSTADRVQMMEHHISHLYELLGSSTSRQINHSPETTVSGIDPVIESPGQHMVGLVHGPDLSPSPNHNGTFTLARPRPPIAVIEHFVDVYRAKIHLQPLPLFRLENLANQLLAGPQYVLFSFLSFMLMTSSHGFFKDQEKHAENFYVRNSEDEILRMSSCGELRSGLAQSLCLIALKHIKSSRPARAWMTIGNASRLYSMRALFNRNAALAPEDDSEARGYWSVFVLERLFLPYVSELPATKIPEFPQSAPLPPPPLTSSTIGNSSIGPAPETVEEPPDKDIGINGYCLGIISIWGKLKLYLNCLSQGEVEKPWLADSQHTKIGIELIEFEARHSKYHLLLNVAFPNRSAAEVDQHSEYWNPWMMTEILWHASQAILNHPFLHLVVLRSQKDIPQSCVFLQQKVDMALYHVSWLFRILQFSEGLMVISNPLIGDAIASCATVLWLFQFSKDAKVAQRTRDNLDTCEKLMSIMAHMWPHVSQKLTTLRKLRMLADQNRAQAAHHEATINYKPEWLWDLLLPSMPEMNNTLGPNPTAEPGNYSTSKMRLRSHFIDRFPDESDSGREHDRLGAAQFSLDSFPIGLDDFEQFRIEELSRGFLETDFWNMVND